MAVVDFCRTSTSDGLSLFNQWELSDLARDLNLSKLSSELLDSRMQEKRLLHAGTSVTFYRYREKDLIQYFTSDDGLVYCRVATK